MTTSELIKKIAECLDEQRDDITLDSNLDEFDGWDSLGRLGIANFFSETFGATVDRMVLKNCRQIGDVVDMVKDQLED